MRGLPAKMGVSSVFRKRDQREMVEMSSQAVLLKLSEAVGGQFYFVSCFPRDQDHIFNWCSSYIEQGESNCLSPHRGVIYSLFAGVLPHLFRL